jgi:hypothetical protein
MQRLNIYRKKKGNLKQSASPFPLDDIKQSLRSSVDDGQLESLSNGLIVDSHDYKVGP